MTDPIYWLQNLTYALTALVLLFALGSWVGKGFKKADEKLTTDPFKRRHGIN